MNRYSNIQTVEGSNGIKRTKLMYNIGIDDNDEFIFIHNPERIKYSMENLAYQYYGDKSLWWIIAKANDVKLPFNFDIENIRIPQNISKIQFSIT